ncbi:MAG: hypothetical protein WC617_11345 [Rhodanobacter sp.]
MAKSSPATHVHYHRPDTPEPYVIAPVAMVEYDPERPLSPAARLVRIFLRALATRPRWTIYIAHVQRAMHITEAKWVSVRRELEAQGYYRAVKLRTPEGKWEWQHHIYEIPMDPANAKTIPPETGNGGTMDGQAGDTRSPTPCITTSRSSIAREREPAPPAAAGMQKSKVKRVLHGMVCWCADEVADAERIAATYEPEDVAAAVAQLLAGKSYPGHVEAAIQSNIKARKDLGAANRGHRGTSMKDPIETPLQSEMRYIEQMHRYGRFTDDERDRERAKAIAKHGSRNKDGSP